MGKPSDEALRVLIARNKQLPDFANSVLGAETVWTICTELLELRKEIARLREALKPIAAQKTYFEYADEEDPDELDWSYAMEEAVKLARAALSPKVDE